MIEIKCPRCEQYWYDNDEEAGHVRLCSRCADELRRKRGHRAEVDVPFLIVVGMVLVFDVMMIALTALMPAVFGKVMLGLSMLLWIAGWVTFRVLQVEGGLTGWFFPFAGNIDWHIGRWALLMVLSAMAFFAAYGSFVGLRH
jgi:hypothetical protein